MQVYREGQTVARCTVERLMRRLSLRGAKRGKLVRTTPMGWLPTRPPVGYFGSIKASSRAQGTTCSISPRNFSRRVTRFFWVN